VEKLEKFIQEERERAHHIAHNLILKKEALDAKLENVARLKKERKEEIKQRNIEMAAKAGNKA